MTEKKASVTTEDINKPKKAVAKKAAPKKIEAEDVSDEGKFIIVFESGAGYATASGIHFSQTNKIAEVSEEEGKRLLELDNFRLPSDEEKELYYTNQED